MALDSTFVLKRARHALRIEQDALEATREALGPDFVAVARAVEAAIAAGRKLVFTGVGKSAHIAQKLTGTFNSTGAPS
ncbi:MAG: KpsF/GutQ family sugar-phosphate isomerase, partial [Opitutaceae bacterium]|nr:KpsF/GutQ family sugar-phosphate isomerase [Opitutaceae bacterium]